MEKVELLVVGAGPHGFATAAYARELGLDFLMVGEPMGFWRNYMPRGMFLRSTLGWEADWDPLQRYTFAHYLEDKGISERDMDPIPIGAMLDYGEWYEAQAGLHAKRSLVRHLRRVDGCFEADLDTGETFRARNVAMAIGPRYFANVPDFAKRLPSRCYAHSIEVSNFGFLKGKRCVIVGGRQSAFEWATLIREEGGAEVQITFRHPPLKFERPAPGKIEAALAPTLEKRGGFLKATPEERERIWSASITRGRDKLALWLEPRFKKASIRTWPLTQVVRCQELPSGEVEVALNTGDSLRGDFLMLATGFVVDVSRIPFLCKETILPHLQVADGYPVLDDDLQSTVPGLFFTGLVAQRDHGPAYGFVVAAKYAGKYIAQKVRQRQTRRRQ